MRIGPGLWCALALAGAACDAYAQSSTFFKSRGNDRCTTLNTWTDGIQARYPGVDLYVSISPSIEQAAFESFFDAAFVPVYGKAFRELTDGDKRAIQDAIARCYPRASWQAALSAGFETNPKRMNMHWREMIARIPKTPTPLEPKLAASSTPTSFTAPAEAAPYLVVYKRKVPLGNHLLSPCPNLRTTDVYFAPDVYGAIAGLDSYDPRGVVDGQRLDCTLREIKMTVADVESVAAETFMRRAEGAGIARVDTVRAMHEGRFNPAWEDVALAWRGLVRLDGNSLPATTIAAMQRDGRWKDGRPDRALVEPYVLAVRPEVWQRTFGSYEQLPRGDYLRELFEALAAGSAPSAALLARYSAVRETGSYGQRMAVITKESAERRAAEAAEAERYANMSDSEKIMAFLDRAMSRFDGDFDRIDALEESMLDPGGVLYANSSRGGAPLKLCNQSGKQLRIASLFLLRKRRDRFDTSVPSEYASRGWSELRAGECAGIRVGADSIVFVALQYRAGDRYVNYGSPSSDFSDSDFEVITTRILRVDFKACVKPDGNFAQTVPDPESLTQCQEGFRLEEFNHALQFGDRTNLTVTIR